jgi:NAD(P)-dependent dehydrogenase (short-subunit alcohol dehydrogenase family)
MEELKSRSWHLDAVFTCAGMPQPLLKLADTPDELYREMFAVHMDGTYWTIKEACQQFISQAEAGRPGGSIVAISSLAADFGAARLHAYAASKGGVGALVRSIAVEMARYGVRANIIVPGWIETDLSATLREVVADKALNRIPARRWGQPEELGGIAVYLASEASSYHSGDTIVIDGGYSVA